MRYQKIFFYLFIGAFSGALFNICQTASVTSQDFFKCVGFGALGGFIPGFLREAIKYYIPFLQSWTMIVILIFFIQFLSGQSDVQAYWVALAYGFLAHLLWEAYEHKLPKIY